MTSRALAAVLAVILLSACGGGAAPSAPSPASVPAGDYELRGVVVALDRARLLVEIDQEAIAGVMPAMTMPYEVASAGILDGIAAGDRVRGTLRIDARGYVIVALLKT